LFLFDATKIEIANWHQFLIKILVINILFCSGAEQVFHFVAQMMSFQMRQRERCANVLLPYVPDCGFLREKSPYPPKGETYYGTENFAANIMPFQRRQRERCASRNSQDMLQGHICPVEQKTDSFGTSGVAGSFCVFMSKSLDTRYFFVGIIKCKFT
jgi:hypothetical protein